MNRFLLLLFVAVSAVTASSGNAYAGAKARTAVGARAVWKAGPAFMDKVHASCDALSFPQLGECLAGVMKQEGASREAVRFAGSMGNEAWLRAFRDTGRVDIAYLTYPFRANENQGILLVNGEPSPIDVDGSGIPVESELKKDLVYQGLAKRYPGISVWPGDRFGTETPVAESLANGGSRFHVGYVLRDGCHACEEIGSVVFAFDFDASGKFLGTRLMVVTDRTMPGISDPATPITVKSGQEFSLVLASNPTTGYRWDLAAPLVESRLRLSGKSYSPATPGIPGSGGTETWNFKASGKERAVVFLRYARPWEKGGEPLRQAVFVILVR